MSPAPTANDMQLRVRIDTPEFAETLAADAEGKFVNDVNSYLRAWKAQIKSFQETGLSSGEFSDLTRLSSSIQTAESVIEFFVKLQKLPLA